ncbi:acyl-CoA synthetase [Microbacterium sp. 1P10UB]|uniref:acyl-CoA synthetase n=1 Tax=unclassified Microbacterium TaxID=2609290 RepID=UPI0039A3AF85
MTSATPARAFELRHVQLARALFAAIAAVMITFSPDHSAGIGLSVFSGFAIATGLIFGLSAWLVLPAGQRCVGVTMGILSLLAGMIGGITTARSTTLFFVVVIVWALATGLTETIAGARALRAAAPGVSAERGAARDALTVGVITLVLGAALLFVPTQYALQYYIAEADRSFTLTGITIGVGVLGGYAAIVAVYLAIAGFSPRRETDAVTTDGSSAVVEAAASTSTSRASADLRTTEEAPGGTA